MANPLPVDPGLAEYASPFQRQLIEAILQCGSVKEAAGALKVDVYTITRSMRRLEAQAAAQGYAPKHDWTHPVPKPHIVSGVSTLYGDDGTIRAQWVKTKLTEQQQLELVEAFVDGIAEEVAKKSKIFKEPAHTEKDLLGVIPIGDPHIGMYAWALETGEDFDVEIASRDLKAGISILVDKMPRCGTCVILPLGDTFHSDNYDGMTSRSGNRLDVDTRYPRVLSLGAKVIIWAVEYALQRHGKVVVKAMPGNHDDVSTVALTLILEAYFRNNKRVTVDTGPGAFWYYKFGKVLIASTHGHNTKPDQLPHIIAHDAREWFGQTLFHYWYTGHIHTRRSFEYPTCLVETFRTLASKDAWTAARGLRSGRDVNAIVHHKDFGEVQRFRADIALIRSKR